MDSILNSIKKLIGIDEADKSFDIDLVMHINTVLIILTQLGVGPAEGFSIEDEDTEWHQYLDNKILLEPVKSYIALKVRLIFDPPTSSSVMEAIKRTVDELEWRINVIVDPEVD